MSYIICLEISFFPHLIINWQFSAFTFDGRCWPRFRWTPMRWELGRTWVISSWWRLRRRSTGCKTTGTAGTSLSRPHLETTWSSPAFVGWWMTRKWCSEMDEVVISCFVCLPHKSHVLSCSSVNLQWKNEFHTFSFSCSTSASGW